MPADVADLESSIRETGLRLYGLMEETELPSVFKKQYWMGKVLDWCMRDDAFKVEMFRFIDVFPALTRPESVARHLKEYFSGSRDGIPSVLKWGIRFLPPGNLAGKVIAKTVARNVAAMGKQFIVGETPYEALPILRDLRSSGLAFSVDLLGEAAVSEREAEDYLERYLELLDILDADQGSWPTFGSGAGGFSGAGGSGGSAGTANLDWGVVPKAHVSIKASAMNSQMDAKSFNYSVNVAKERLRPIFRKAAGMGAFVTLDMEHTALKDLTLALYRSISEEREFRDYPYSGIAVQAYLRETEQDVRELIQWARNLGKRFTIRLVKGAYWDAEVIWARQKNWPIPVFTSKHETDASFERIARLILENHEWVRLGCASHNIRSISYVMELAAHMGLPGDACEFQVLYGMAEPVRNALLKAGLPVRLYAPVGDMIPGMAYLVRRLLENTANESFLRQSFVVGVPKEELLRNPLELLEGEVTAFRAGNGHPSGATRARAATDRPSGIATHTRSTDTESIVYDEYHEPGRGGGTRGSDALSRAGVSPFLNEPPADWTVSSNRKQFRNALDKMRRSFPLRVPLHIGGKSYSTRSEIRSANPNKTSEVVGIVAAAGRLEAERAVDAAVAAFPEWRDTPPDVRAGYLFRAAEAARSMRAELSALEVFEVGKTWSEADADVCEAIDFLEYYGREMIGLGAPRRMGRVPGEMSVLFYEPRGVAAVVAPWNFPFAIPVGMVSAAIVTGNTVVFKPSSQSAVTGSMIYRIFEKSKLPPGVLNFLPGPGGEIGDFLVSHPDVALIAFTGSKEVGVRIIELARTVPDGSFGVKNVIAEMGGKNAIIVDADADLDEAVQHVLHSAFDYQGQKCSACSRLIVLEENYDKVVERLKAAAESVHLGPTEDPRSFMGAVVDESAMRKILHYIEIGKQEGAVLLERRPSETGGNFVPLTIFENIRPEHRLANEEIFGPVLSIMKAHDFDEALDIANNTRYALTGAVFSRSPANIDRARREFRVGNLYINRGCTGAIVGRHPFGGFKMSGIGSKAGGPDYLLQFMIPRNVAENTLRRGFAPMES